MATTVVGTAAIALVGAARASAADLVATEPTSGTVPTGMCTAEVVAIGGSGRVADPGVGGYEGQGGYGAEITASFVVVPGQAYEVLFAPGGEPGPDLGLGNTGGRGGDASAVSFGGVVMVAAGGGGGAGGSSGTGIFAENGFMGGNAGYLWNDTGSYPGQNGVEFDQRYDDGQGGLSSGPGGAGHPEASNGQAGTAAPGSIGAGGAGGAGDPGTVATPSGPGGGGGGAGYNTGAGGGGGANNNALDAYNQAGGGGGGASFVHPSAVTHKGVFTEQENYEASVSITWKACTGNETVPPSTVAPVVPPGVSTSSGVTGTVPAGVCEARVVLVGASGTIASAGTGGTSGQPGQGESMEVFFEVTAGESFEFLFAEGGEPGPDLGLGGTGGRGGDAVAVRFSGQVVAAAGGGGGAGGVSGVNEVGYFAPSAGTFYKTAGNAFGANAYPLSQSGDDGQGGLTSGAGGAGHPEATGGQAGTSAPGSIGAGGDGGAGDPGSVVTPSGPGGGGGGAGYGTGAGGGGGANNNAGGNQAGSGGSGGSYIDPSALWWFDHYTAASITTASASITWSLCPAAPPTTEPPVTDPPVTDPPVTDPPPVTTPVTSVAGGPRTLPSTGSTSPSVVLWGTMLLLSGTVLLLRSRRRA